eukprot:COSAG03_NODE_23011_length_284_cov_0.837838_1_plen_44_part_10
MNTSYMYMLYGAVTAIQRRGRPVQPAGDESPAESAAAPESHTHT